MRKFNTYGLCVPEKHYMADITDKIGLITSLIDEGLYFTINQARQYGKTTTLYMIKEHLKTKCYVVRISFEGTGGASFRSEEAFCRMFAEKFRRGLEFSGADSTLIGSWTSDLPDAIEKLDIRISDLCKAATRPVVLMIDEFDKSSNNELFLDFLGMLREKYLSQTAGEDHTFKSVILAGVYDLKNLKLKITGEKKLSDLGERAYNSPWNIDFTVDMSFIPSEIAAMLESYEDDRHTGMDTTGIAAGLHRFTGGYPFLVSRLCKTIDEELERDWTQGGIEAAVKLLTKSGNTLFDDLFKNLESSRRLYDLVHDIVIDGAERTFAVGNPEIELGRMLGVIVDRNGKAAVSNLIFEIMITNYLVSKNETETGILRRVVKTDAIENGRLNLQTVLEKFARHYRELYDERDLTFLERHGRLLFITYLRPFINGQGFYHIESETRDARRMDLVVDYNTQQFIIELKLWHGEKLHEDAFGQLCSYLDDRNASEGYLLTFDFRKGDREIRSEWVTYMGKRIFSITV